jgi:hypothetical protein
MAHNLVRLELLHAGPKLVQHRGEGVDKDGHDFDGALAQGD